MNDEREVRLSDLVIPDYDVRQAKDGDLWVNFLGFLVHLNPTDEGLVVDVWPNNGSGQLLASTYAFTSELEA